MNIFRKSFFGWIAATALTAVLVGVVTPKYVEAQGPFTAQIQRALTALGITFEVDGNMGVSDFFTLTTVNTTAATGTDCDAAGETGRFHWDSTNDSLEICSGASGWSSVSPAALVADTLTMSIANPDIQLSRSAAGTLSIAAVTGTNNEVWTIDLETTANTLTWATSTGVTNIANPFDFEMGAGTQSRFGNLEGSVTDPAFCWDDAGGNCDTGFYQPGTNQIEIALAAEAQVALRSGRLSLQSDGFFGWSNNATDAGATIDLKISRDSDSVMAWESGDNAVVLDAIVTAGSGTGVTVDAKGFLRRQVYKVSVTQDHWVDAALTQDLTIATLPAKTRITEVIADVTEQFACTAVCTSSTLSMVLGIGSGGAEYLDSFDVDAATAQFGLVDAERGASLQGIINGEMPSWGSTTTIVVRLTSGTGNLGDGDATTNLSGGDVTFYITTEEMP